MEEKPFLLILGLFLVWIINECGGQAIDRSSYAEAGKPLAGTQKCLEGTEVRLGICVCVPEGKMYAGDDGKCYPKKAYADSCTKDEECIYERKFLSCVGGECGCSPGKFVHQTFNKEIVVERLKEVQVYTRENKRPGGPDYYNEKAHLNMRGTVVYAESVIRSDHKYAYINYKVNQTEVEVLSQCVGMSRQGCNPESNCVKDSTCVPAESSSSSGNVPGICECKAGLSPTSKGTCGLGEGQYCSMLTPCSDSLRCSDGFCDCPQLKHQIYDQALQKCVGLVSSFCSTEDDCSGNSTCSVNPRTQAKQCRCAAHFVENFDGKCEIAYGNACISRYTCDSIARLKCRNGLCSCADTMSYFNASLRKCVGLVGSRCRSSSAKATSAQSNADFENVCVAHANCIQEHPGVAGQCLCNGGYTVNSEMQCTLIESAEDIDVVSVRGGENDVLGEDGSEQPELQNEVFDHQ